MHDQDRIKYLEIIERVLVDEWTKTRELETKAVIDKIREELRRLHDLLSHTDLLKPLIVGVNGSH